MSHGCGWVKPNPGGVKARCGGPGICPDCAKELMLDINRRCAALPDVDTTPQDEVLGYDEVLEYQMRISTNKSRKPSNDYILALLHLIKSKTFEIDYSVECKGPWYTSDIRKFCSEIENLICQLPSDGSK